MSPLRSAGPGRGGGPALSRLVVCREGLALLDEHGSGALTMRSLGARLGIEAMSLYHYVTGREDLLDGVAEVMVGEIRTAGSRGWDEAVRSFAVGIRQVALRHRDAFQLVGMRPLSLEAAGDIVVPLLLQLRTAGLSPTDGVVVYRLLAAYARGFSLAEIAGLTLTPPSGREADQGSGPAELRDFHVGLSRGCGDLFAEGLAVIVEGIQARFGPARADPGD